jgi:hypothetical protein
VVTSVTVIVESASQRASALVFGWNAAIWPSGPGRLRRTATDSVPSASAIWIA